MPASGGPNQPAVKDQAPLPDREDLRQWPARRRTPANRTSRRASAHPAAPRQSARGQGPRSSPRQCPTSKARRPAVHRPGQETQRHHHSIPVDGQRAELESNRMHQLNLWFRTQTRGKPAPNGPEVKPGLTAVGGDRRAAAMHWRQRRAGRLGGLIGGRRAASGRRSPGRATSAVPPASSGSSARRS